MASAAALGGSHLRDANRDLRELQKTYSVWEFNALLMAIRKHSDKDREANPHLPIFVFANFSGGLIPDTIVPIYDVDPPYTPVADPFCRTRPENIKRPQANTRNNENFAMEACLSAPTSYMQPSRSNTPSAPYFVVGPD